MDELVDELTMAEREKVVEALKILTKNAEMRDR